MVGELLFEDVEWTDFDVVDVLGVAWTKWRSDVLVKKNIKSIMRKIR